MSDIYNISFDNPAFNSGVANGFVNMATITSHYTISQSDPTAIADVYVDSYDETALNIVVDTEAQTITVTPLKQGTFTYVVHVKDNTWYSVTNTVTSTELDTADKVMPIMPDVKPEQPELPVMPDVKPDEAVKPVIEDGGNTPDEQTPSKETPAQPEQPATDGNSNNITSTFDTGDETAQSNAPRDTAGTTTATTQATLPETGFITGTSATYAGLAIVIVLAVCYGYTKFQQYKRKRGIED